MKTFSILALSLGLAANAFALVSSDGGFLPHIGANFSEFTAWWGQPVSVAVSRDDITYNFMVDGSEPVAVSVPTGSDQANLIDYSGTIPPSDAEALLRVNSPLNSAWTEAPASREKKKIWRLTNNGFLYTATYQDRGGKDEFYVMSFKLLEAK
jgi:hypothetical protein